MIGVNINRLTRQNALQLIELMFSDDRWISQIH